MRDSRSADRFIRRTIFARRIVVPCLLVCLGMGGRAGAEMPKGLDLPLSWSLPRRPVALAFDRSGKRLFTANRSTGTVSVIDARKQTLIAESKVGKQLVDLASLPFGNEWLALDQAGNSLLLLHEDGGKLQVSSRIELKPDPVRLALGPDGATCVVASRWGRSLTFLARDQPGVSFRQVKLIDLPFSPRELRFVREGEWLVVADAFGGGIAVVDARAMSLVRVGSLAGHNLRGLALTPDGTTLLVAHQELNPRGRAIHDDVQWGGLLTNKIRALELDELLRPESTAKPLATPDSSHLIDLGRVSGDPSAIACDQRGRIILTLAGVDQIVFGPDFAHPETRILTGRLPTALATNPAGTQVYVAETLDDTVGIYEVPTGRLLGRVSLSDRTEPTIEERGERLFHDARISRGSWMSCQSCHTDGHSNGQNVDTVGDGDYGAPKRVPSLLGTGETGPWGWNGRLERLDEQVHQSAVTTMQGVWPTETEVAELSAYLRTLRAPQPRPTASSQKAAFERGRTLFDARCRSCHAPPEYTSDQRYDVGLTDEMGRRQFNPPSLRGVGVRAPLLHDGRASTLDEVFRKHGHPRNSAWTDREISDLIAFLESL